MAPTEKALHNKLDKLALKLERLFLKSMLKRLVKWPSNIKWREIQLLRRYKVIP